jgi:hypothetical protein
VIDVAGFDEEMVEGGRRLGSWFDEGKFEATLPVFILLEYTEPGFDLTRRRP